MKSHVTAKFRRHFEDLPSEVRQRAHQSYRLWKENPAHPGVQFKRVHQRRPADEVPPASGSCGYKDLAAHPASARPESIPTLPGEATEASEPGTVEPASDTTWCTVAA